MFAREPMLQEQFPGPGGAAQFIEAVRRMPPQLIAQLVHAGFQDGNGALEDNEGPDHGAAQQQRQAANADERLNMFEAADEMWRRDYVDADQDHHPDAGQGNDEEDNANTNAEASGSGAASGQATTVRSGGVDGAGEGGQGGQADAVCTLSLFFF